MDFISYKEKTCRKKGRFWTRGCLATIKEIMALPESVNYNLIYLGKENDQWKVIDYLSAPLDSLIDNGYSFGSEDEVVALKILKARENGIEINKNGKVLGYNGAKGIFLPEVTITCEDENKTEVYNAILKVFLEHFKSVNTLSNEKLID